ncbi:TetR family transcriptional regulator [Lentzea sp. NBRC 105346]|uniref:TetR/AcrR family transcriptional regulator n=1 Tax=Lentzea sp. NBRC 105346 TaxID=3032205 RepID=UPI002556B1F0|nr:TetR family transcriptional regulator [Lentzea sp. NBRC 105346]
MDQRTRRSPASGERKRDPERTKARIIAAAIEEFGAHGYAATRTSDIAARAGVNKQLISYYFGGKEGLYREISGQWHQTGGEMASLDLPLADAVAGFVPRTPEMHSLGRLMVWENMSEGTPDAGGTEFFQRQVSLLRERQAAGEIPADLDPECLLIALMAMGSASLVLPQVVRQVTGSDPASESFSSRYAEQLARLVRHLAGGTDG